MRAVQRHTDKPESQPATTETAPVQRRDALQGLDYATAVQRLAPVQLKEDTANVHSAAQRGTSGGGGSLPYLGQIQKSFGGHDVSGIKSHTGGKASEACESMGAEAYASGQDVAFKGQPDLHTAAHEAAHIVQQRAGVQLSGGVGKAGDPYEKNADEVADRVVQGKSAEDLLGGPSFGGAAAVQRSVQMKGGLLDKLKSYFLEAKLTGPQQQVAKILAEKHGVDVSGLSTTTFASLYKDAGGDNPKQSPDKTAANMASAARDHVGGAKKPTQKKESGVVSGVAVQRKEARNVQRQGGAAALSLEGQRCKAVITYLYPAITTTVEPNYEAGELQAFTVGALDKGIEASSQIRAVLKLHKATSIGSLASATAQAVIAYLRSKHDEKMLKAVKNQLTIKALSDIATSL